MKNRFYWKYVHTALTNTIGVAVIFGIGFLYWIGS